MWEPSFCPVVQEIFTGDKVLQEGEVGSRGPPRGLGGVLSPTVETFVVDYEIEIGEEDSLTRDRGIRDPTGPGQESGCHRGRDLPTLQLGPVLSSFPWDVKGFSSRERVKGLQNPSATTSLPPTVRVQTHERTSSCTRGPS